MGGMERRAKFREEQAGRAAKLMSLSQSAIQGRQQQEVISLKAQEDEQVEMLRQRFAGMAPDEILRAAPPEMQTTDALVHSWTENLRQVVSQMNCSSAKSRAGL